MKCPFCNENNTSVSYTRNKESFIKRRRTCGICSGFFFTKEEPVPISAYVIKKDQRKEIFCEKKIMDGLKAATVKRPQLQDHLPKLIQKVKQYIFSHRKQTIHATELADFLLKELKNLDQIAYLRFASVQSPNKIEEIINQLPSNMIKNLEPEHDIIGLM